MFRILSYPALRAILRSAPVWTHPIPLIQPFSSKGYLQESPPKNHGQKIDGSRIANANKLNRPGDALISDINLETLRSKIATKLGIEYLSKANMAEARNKTEAANGYIFGKGFRPIVPLRVAYQDIACWVIFLVDSGAPFTCLSNQVSVLEGVMKLIVLTIVGIRSPEYRGTSVVFKGLNRGV